LKEFHVAFHSYYKGIFSVEFLYEVCCEEFELLHHSPDNKGRNGSYEETVNHKQDFIEHDVSLLEIKEGILLPSDNILALEFAKEFFDQETMSTNFRRFCCPWRICNMWYS
jgi:hypothetical protein